MDSGLAIWRGKNMANAMSRPDPFSVTGDWKMKAICKTIVLALLISMYGNAYSQIDCAGTVDNLSLQLDTSGTVTLSLSGGPAFTYLCNLDGIRNGVSPVVCRAMYASLMAAKTTGKRVSIRFYDYATCSAIPAWANSGALGWTVLLFD
jgi:hypothetical protein